MCLFTWAERVLPYLGFVIYFLNVVRTSAHTPLREREVSHVDDF